MAWYYTFEAKEIQRFILQSDKLRDMVGGSELINHLCTDFLRDALRAVGVENPEQAIIACAAGWARIRFEDEAVAREFHAFWPMLADRFAPGVKVIQALVKIDGALPDAMQVGFGMLRAARNVNRPELPEVGPLIDRAPRTGAAAVALIKERNADKLIPVDRQTLRKRQLAQTHASLTRKISEEFAYDAWPYELDDIVGDDSAYVAVIHADGNDLGATVMRINDHLKKRPEDAGEIYRGFSRAVEEITVAAVRTACEATIFAEFREQAKQGKKAKLAARPIVLGGDDLTIIIRADHAVKFTEVFLEAFEKISRKKLQEKKGLGSFKVEFPKALTACAGIAFVKKSYPFAAAYRMAETLCEHTKHAAKADRDRRGDGDRKPPVPSSFTFHRITTSMAEGFGEVKKNELTGRCLAGGSPVKFWFGPYVVGQYDGSLPSLTDLESLILVLRKIPTGSVRSLIGTLHASPQDALKDYGRIRQVAGKQQGAELHQALTALTHRDENPLWNANLQTPLYDARLLRELAKGGAHE